MNCNFPFDIQEAQRTGTFICGIGGTGKSDVGMHLAKAFIDNGIIVYVFDDSRDWMKRSTVPYYLSIKENAPQLVYSLSTSMIFDISLLTVRQAKNVVQKFCRSLFHERVQNPKPTIVIFEEAQIYLPEGSMKSKASEEIMRLVTVGRNYGLRFVLITPFASNVDKLCIKSCKQKYLGFTDERNDKEYLKSFIGERVDELETLKTGEFIYSCGAQTERVKIPEFNR